MSIDDASILSRIQDFLFPCDRRSPVTTDGVVRRILSPEERQMVPDINQVTIDVLRVLRSRPDLFRSHFVTTHTSNGSILQTLVWESHPCRAHPDCLFEGIHDR